MKPNRTKGNDRSRVPSKCLWFKAGVIDHLPCDRDYQCDTCETDKELKLIAQRNKTMLSEGLTPSGPDAGIVDWKEKMREKPLGKQFCLHHLKGRIDVKNCTNNYTCYNCDFDQFFQDQYAVHAVIHPIDVLDVNGFKMPQGYYFHAGHTWVKIEEGSEVRIGLDDFTFRILGSPDRIEAPLIGKELIQGEGQITFVRGGHSVKLPSPVSGVVTAVNHKLVKDGTLAKASPYTDGWVLRVHATNLRMDLKNLTMGTDQRDTLHSEIEQLYQLIEDVSQPMAADGGNLVDDIFGAMPDLGWEQLIGQFFGAE